MFLGALAAWPPTFKAFDFQRCNHCWPHPRVIHPNSLPKWAAVVYTSCKMSITCVNSKEFNGIVGYHCSSLRIEGGEPFPPPKFKKNISAVPYINICKESTTSRHEVMKLPHFGPIILVTIASGCACRGGTWGSLPGRRSCLVPSFEGLNYYPPGK